MPILSKILRWISYGLAVLALAASIGLLIGDVGIGTLPRLSAAAATAAPLLLVGTSFLFVQPVIRPRLVELLKNVLLAATFLLWGIIQLMPQNAMSMRLGNVVIALYVLDLAWMTLGTVNSQERN
jgi:sulfite exporter TauE/SafE